VAYSATLLICFHSASTGVGRWDPSSCHVLVVGVEVCGHDFPRRVVEVRDEVKCSGVSEPSNRVVAELVDESVVNDGDPNGRVQTLEYSVHADGRFRRSAQQ
jgi:hypothetical protein